MPNPIPGFDEHPMGFRYAFDLGFYRSIGIRAVDGDTLDVWADQGLRTYQNFRIRLRNANTPEMYGVTKESEEYKAGKAAQEFVAERIEGKPLLLYTENDKEKYGRYLALVSYMTENGWVDLGEMLAEAGLGTLQ